MQNSLDLDDNHIDDPVDDEIGACLSFEKPTSFFLFAGAGSGKTRSLVKALNRIREKNWKYLRVNGKRVGVITYTNNACDEIKQRLDFDPLVEVSTIHSFVWSLIKGFHADIKQWLKVNLISEIEELKEKQDKGRAGTKAAIDREKSIEAKTKRLEALTDIKRFTYNPNGDNHGRDSLNHSEVIKIGSGFLVDKPLMQSLLVNKFPILLIDESQDTNKLLMDAFLKTQEQHTEHFVLGLFCDTMQRIYGDGKVDLGQNLPSDWATPAKKMNHRCSLRIVKLLNKIRSVVDEQVQTPRRDKDEGFVRLYILSSSITDKFGVEQAIAERMATITGDSLWREEVKTLILEHHMVAKRMGFLEMYEPLYKVDSLRTSLLDGKLSGIRLFSGLVLPLVEAKRSGDDFAIARIVRKSSPLLSKATLKAAGEDQQVQIQKARNAVETLLNLWSNDVEPSFLDVLRSIAQTKLFEIPESLLPIAARTVSEQEIAEEEMADENMSDDDGGNEIIDAWDEFLLTPFAQIKPYFIYVTGQANFGTHQGVKGLEFPRVMVIIDDTAARGFLFQYEKLFGVKEKTAADLKNEGEGKETGIDRTRRLFYVTCSRAETSLAIVAYSENPEKVRDHVISEGWFENDEVELRD